MVDNSLTSLKESIRAFRQQFDLIQSSPAEKYFVFHNILSEHKLSLASFYFDGEALEWYRWLFRNKQLAGWDHFVDKLLIHFRSRPRDKQREFLPIPRNKNHRAVDYSQADLNEHSNRNNQSLAHTVFKEMSDKETNVETMGLPAIQVCHLAEHDNTSTSLEIQYDVLAGNSEVDHMFDKMPEKKIDMEVEHPVINDSANLASHMFDEIFQTVSTFKGEYGDLLMEFDHANLPLSLYRFPPDQFECSFPFDPGSSLLPRQKCTNPSGDEHPELHLESVQIGGFN
ncbi:hypothetical protein KY285_021373 [Solanum tuberosum]|nr:hypothetical protein KY285_021373 [Solanum tuberosum]